MPDTIVHSGEEAVTGTVAAIAGDVGRVSAEVAHHAESLAAHDAQLVDVKDQTQWLKSRLDNLEVMVTEAPPAAIAELREQIAAVKTELTTQLAALSEASVAATTTEPQTEAPPPQFNAAAEQAKSGPLGGLRKALHRLL